MQVEVAKDGQSRITFLSYDPQPALLAYLADSTTTHSPGLADAPGGLLSLDEPGLVRRLFSNLVKATKVLGRLD